MSLQRRIERAVRRARQRGATAAIFALMLIGFVGGLMALVIDGGHMFEVRNELQNAGDSAALAGVLDLNGTTAQYSVAVASAKTYASKNTANGTAVTLHSSGTNQEIWYGHWDTRARAFTPWSASMAPYAVNAVKVIANRTAADGDAVPMFFAPMIGISQRDVSATAIAVGGGPSKACGFPVVVAACSIVDASNNLQCGQTLCFGSSTSHACLSGFTSFALTANTPNIDCAFAQSLGVPNDPGHCPSSCTCNGSPICQATSTTAALNLGNGNNFSKPSGNGGGANDVDNINWAITQAGPSGLYVQAAVVDTGQPPGCGAGTATFNQSMTPVGYLTIHVLAACPTADPKYSSYCNGSDKDIVTAVDCSHSSNQAGGGNVYGTPSTAAYLAQ